MLNSAYKKCLVASNDRRTDNKKLESLLHLDKFLCMKPMPVAVRSTFEVGTRFFVINVRYCNELIRRPLGCSEMNQFNNIR